MKINSNFEVIAEAHSKEMAWEPSPMAGVSRKMLDRVGDEVARATSIVRYDPGSKFSSHVHAGGEEFLVLNGTFQDEHGDFPEGTYVRNPIDTEHTPSSEKGCEIFVKLWQFNKSEADILRVDTTSLELKTEASNDQVSSAILFEDSKETVSIESWAPQAKIKLQHRNGLEILVIDGSFATNDSVSKKEFLLHSWLRIPPGEEVTVVSGLAGARIWSKRGHLQEIRVPT